MKKVSTISEDSYPLANQTSDANSNSAWKSRVEDFKAQPSQFRAKSSLSMIGLITAPLLLVNYWIESQIQSYSSLVFSGVHLKMEIAHIFHNTLFSFSLF